MDAAKLSVHEHCVQMLAPFKGVCRQCGKRTIVRHYPYNASEWLGTFCKDCFEWIDKDISEGGVFVADESEEL